MGVLAHACPVWNYRSQVCFLPFTKKKGEMKRAIPYIQ